MITKLISRATLLFRPTPSLFKPLYAFSNQEVNEQNNKSNDAFRDDEEIDRAANFYRKSIRRININDKGRGKFTQHHLLRLIKLTEKIDQVPLLFEAYYNYLGHFTVISNNTVDKMLQKAMSFEEVPLQSVLDVYSVHNYLTYFPHYNTTQRFISLAQKDEEIYKKLLDVFFTSPLIKFNKPIVDRLVQQLQDQQNSKGVFSLIIKLLMQRSAFGIINELIPPAEVLQRVTQGLQARISSQQFQTISSNQYVNEFLNVIKQDEPQSQQLHYQLAVIYLSFGSRTNFFEHLSQIKEKSSIERIFSLIQGCKESYRGSVVSYLQSQQVNDEIKGYLEQINRESEPAKEQ